jgi:hypothetical protein
MACAMDSYPLPFVRLLKCANSVYSKNVFGVRPILIRLSGFRDDVWFVRKCARANQHSNTLLQEHTSRLFLLGNKEDLLL